VAYQPFDAEDADGTGGYFYYFYLVINLTPWFPPEMAS